MLTKLYGKSSYLASLLSYTYMTIVIILKIRENYNYQKSETSLIEYIGFIVLFIVMLESYNSWINNSARSDGINTTERSIIHMILFPIVISFMPSEIINLDWILGVYFAFLAYKKYGLSLNNLKEEALIESGMFMSFSIMFSPYFLGYLALIIVRIFPTGKFTFSKVLALVLPTAITWFLLFTFNTFSKFNLEFYKLINQKENFSTKIIEGFEGNFLIILTTISLLGMILVSKRNLYKLERNTHYSRITLFIVHLLVIYFIASPEALILLTSSIVYGLGLLIRSTKKIIYKELLILTILLFSACNIYLSF